MLLATKHALRLRGGVQGYADLGAETKSSTARTKREKRVERGHQLKMAKTGKSGRKGRAAKRQLAKQRPELTPRASRPWLSW